MKSTLLAGTSKGLVILNNTKGEWKITGVGFRGLPISVAYADERTDTWWIGVSHRHWGEKLHRSNDQGRTWTEVAAPNYIDYLYSPGEPAFLKRIWTIQHAGTDKPGCLWIGTEPGGLFYSNDSGNSFKLNEPFWNHPSRQNPKQWFGAGKDFPFIHSIIVDPGDSDHCM